MLCLILSALLTIPVTTCQEIQNEFSLSVVRGAGESSGRVEWDKRAERVQDGPSGLREEVGPHLVLPEGAFSGIAKRVSYCESGLRNIDSQRSSASGYFQFLDSTWYWVTGLPGPASDYTLDEQLDAFYELWDEGRGASHWNPSRYCWEHENPWDHHER